MDPTVHRLSGAQRALAIGALVFLILLAGRRRSGWPGDPWRLQGSILCISFSHTHFPPFSWVLTSDLALHHVWDMTNAFVEPSQRDEPPLGSEIVCDGNRGFLFLGGPTDVYA